jgi:hypothetical protein
MVDGVTHEVGVAHGAVDPVSARGLGDGTDGADGLARLLAGWTTLTADAVATRLRRSAGDVAVLVLRVLKSS